MISEECNTACCTLIFLNTTYSGLTKDYGSSRYPLLPQFAAI